MSVACGDEVDKDGKLAHRIPTSFGVAQTPSGYAVEDAFDKVADHICGASAVIRFFTYFFVPVFTFSRVEFWVNVSRLSPPAIDRPTEEP